MAKNGVAGTDVTFWMHIHVPDIIMLTHVPDIIMLSHVPESIMLTHVPDCIMLYMHFLSKFHENPMMWVPSLDPFSRCSY